MADSIVLPEKAEAALQELLTLTPEQRLIASERLLADVPFEPSPEQVREWERRIGEYEANPDIAVSFEDCMNRLTEKLDARRLDSSGS